MTYASTLARDPFATYRQIDAVGRTATADGPALVQLLYKELVAALRAAAWACEKRKFSVKSERITRATAILFALEAGLDFEQGGQVSETLARLYGGARKTIVNASVGHDPTPFRDSADMLDEIAQAWRTASAA
ncbi:flagellar protein FliS [Sphingomonas sp. PP-CE-3G-477]|uniref:flagellar export chaperone FliS n=1 Tax=unclassified Sphingomonas TaxID=196159 RepID=UPI000D354E23|nr:flagellar protein FliS [Sphingomonas sp. PP-CE-3G-477]MBE2991853.1 flagellar protein FliS [Sphingomonas sp. CFBP 13603]MBE2994228.1 flagellar protein FliS [Sphingomonas sp. CFBP 13603]PTQ63607.1 flagellar protein FliS [Sphingomonas sp. PP-CE-3G-477]